MPIVGIEKVDFPYLPLPDNGGDACNLRGTALRVALQPILGSQIGPADTKDQLLEKYRQHLDQQVALEKARAELAGEVVS